MLYTHEVEKLRYIGYIFLNMESSLHVNGTQNQGSAEIFVKQKLRYEEI